METSSKKRLNVAWLVVVAITVIYLWIDHTAEEDGVPTASTAVTVSAIVLALVKYRIVLREFMDVRNAPPRAPPTHRPPRGRHRRVAARQLPRRTGSRLSPRRSRSSADRNPPRRSGGSSTPRSSSSRRTASAGRRCG